MGLRIGTNQGALTALRNLRANGVQSIRNFERLSTGLKINRGSDSPSGLVILEQLRSQLGSIQQATENTQNAFNLVNVADAALGQVSNRLIDLRSNLIASLNTGALGSTAQRALQQAIDQGVSAINRIGATTRFADQNLLNGNFGFRFEWGISRRGILPRSDSPLDRSTKPTGRHPHFGSGRTATGVRSGKHD